MVLGVELASWRDLEKADRSATVSVSWTDYLSVMKRAACSGTVWELRLVEDLAVVWEWYLDRGLEHVLAGS